MVAHKPLAIVDVEEVPPHGSALPVSEQRQPNASVPGMRRGFFAA